MCAAALVVLFVIAVLAVPALARLVGAAVLILIALGVAGALAEARRATPVPQISSECLPGYSASPTSGTCAPSGGTRCRAFPSPGGSCPTGWTYTNPQ